MSRSYRRELTRITDSGFVASWKGNTARFHARTIDKVFEAIQVISEHQSVLWFRGQTSRHKFLEPGIFRGKKELENRLNLRFRAKAGLRNHPCPKREDLVGWLFLGQHYLLRTRILDWTESLLPAIFFAAGGQNGQDDRSIKENGVVYCLDPNLLNKRMLKERLNAIRAMPGYPKKYIAHFPDRKEYFEKLYRGERIVYPDHPEVLMMARKAFNRYYPHTKKMEFLLAVMSEAIDARQAVQQGTFTIHGERKCFGVATSGDYLLELTFSARLKQALRDALKTMGISKSVMFPNLEHLPWDLDH